MSSFTGSPKPLHRPTLNEGIFKFVEQETVVKGKSPMEVQRDLDGSPYTRTGPTSLRPPQPKLTLKDSDIVSKSAKSCTPGADMDAERGEDTAADPANSMAKAQAHLSSYLVNKGCKLPIEF